MVPALEYDNQRQTGPVAVAVELDETLQVATVPQATRKRCHPDGPLYQVDHQKGNGTVPDKDTVSQEGTIPDEKRVSQKGTENDQDDEASLAPVEDGEGTPVEPGGKNPPPPPLTTVQVTSQ